MSSVQKIISLKSAQQLKQSTDTPVQTPVNKVQQSNRFTPSFRGITKTCSTIKPPTIKNAISRFPKTVAIALGLFVAGAPLSIKANTNTANEIEYVDGTTNSLDIPNTLQLNDGKPKTTIDKKKAPKFNTNTEVAKDAKGIVKQRVDMNDEKFNILTEIPLATQTADTSIKTAYTDIPSKQTVSKIDFAKVVLQYKYFGTKENLNELADFLIGSGLSAEELREKYSINAEFTSESMIDGDTVSQKFKNLLKQEFLGDKKPVKDRTMDEMAESLTTISVGTDNKLQITPDALSIGLPKKEDINLKIPEVLTPENIAKYKENIAILKKTPTGNNVLDVMEHNREGKKRAIEIPATIERKVLADLTVDKIKKVKLSEIDTIFENYASIKLDGLTGVALRNARTLQTKLKKDIAQKLGISDNDIDYSKVDIDDLKAIRDTEKLIQDRENAKVAISEITKSMNDKNFPTASDVQEKISFINENILREINETMPQIKGRVLSSYVTISQNDKEITRLLTLIDDKKKQEKLTEQARESNETKSQRNELRTTIAKLEQQVLSLRLANAYIQENLNMLNAIKTKLNNIETASINARDLLMSYKTALDELQAFDKKSAPIEAEKIAEQDKIAQKRFDKHNKRATKDITSDKIISENRRNITNKKLDEYNGVEQLKVETDNPKQVENIQTKFLNKQDVTQ